MKDRSELDKAKKGSKFEKFKDAGTTVQMKEH